MHTDRIATRPRPARAARLTRKLPGERLRAAVLELAGGMAQLKHHKEQNWASITFAGTRHSFSLAFEGGEAVEAAENFITLLPEHEFTIVGQLVADATIMEVDHCLAPPKMVVRCELLMLEES